MERSSTSRAGSEWGRVALGVVAGFLGLLCWFGGTGIALAAGTFVVDGANPGCSSAGPGTEATPYCSIGFAARARGGPGTTILVKPAIYREQVFVRASGAEGSPFVIQALGPGVVVDGADDFSDPTLWAPVSGTTVWVAASVTEAPGGVFVDGARLSGSPAAPADLPPGTYRLPGDGLYVNLGGDNPGTHQILVGRRTGGFDLGEGSWVTIDGFTITRIGVTGIYANDAGLRSTNLTLTHNTVTFSRFYGIGVAGFTNVLIGSNVVSDSGEIGINLAGGGSSTIQDNEVFRNGGRQHLASGGIRLYGSPNSLIQRNNVHDNGGTGIRINGSSNTVFLQNRSWHNGTHGFHDGSSSRGTLHVGDVAWGNAGRGFSVGWEATDTHLFNSIGVNNGLTTGEFDLAVDSTATPGFASNANLFWNSTSQPPIKYAGTKYATLAAFTAATGQDAQSLQAHPRFLHPEVGDFRLRPGSPAIDAADSSVPNWPATDAAGQARVDDPATPDTGTGPVAYADRGALEFLPFGPPLAALTVTPSGGQAPLAVTADAAHSVDPDGLPLSFLFAFGDGTVVGPQPEATASHTYPQAGTFTVTVTVTDAEGRSDTASATLTVTPANQPPVAALTVTPASGTVRLTVTADASGSTDPDGTIVSYRFDFGDGDVAGPQVSPTATKTNAYSEAGIFAVTVTVTDDLGATGTASTTVTVAPPPTFNFVGNPSFESGAGGWAAYGGSTLQRVPGGVDGAFALEVRGPETTAEFGINDSPNWVAKTLAPGTLRFMAWVRSGASSARARLKVREYLNGVQVGGAISSAAWPLTPAWQLLLVDHVAQMSGSTLDFQVLAAPLAPGAAFEVDQIAIRIVPATTNQPPNGVIDSPATDVTITAGESVTLRGTGSDSDGHLPLTYLWGLGGGAADQVGEDPGAVVFRTPGTYTVRLMVTDSLGVSDPTPDSRVITVRAPNQAPSGTIDSPAGNVTIAAGQSVTFAGTGTDPDGHLPLTFLWSFGGGAANSTAEDPGAVPFNTPGAFTVTFAVTDSLGAADPTPASRVITVIGSGQPPMAALTVTPSSGPAPLPVTLDASGSSDPDGGTIDAYTFDFGDGTGVGPQGAATATHTYPAPGTFTATVTVTDDEGATASTSRLITVTSSNQAPNGVIDTPAANVTILVGQSVTFAGTGTDPEGHLPLTFLWSFGGGAPNSTAQDPGPVTFNTPGTYTVTLTVTDSVGLADPTPDSRVITVTGNQPPNGTIDSPAGNATIMAGQSVTFAGTGTDPEGHFPLSFLWTFGGGAANRTVEDPGPVTFNTPGTYTVTFTVTDSLGAADPTPASRVITVNTN